MATSDRADGGPAPVAPAPPQMQTGQSALVDSPHGVLLPAGSGAEEEEEDAELLARALHKVAASSAPRSATPPARGRSLMAIAQRVADQCNDGAKEADRLDAADKAAVLAFAGFIDRIRRQLIYAGKRSVPHTYGILGFDEFGRPIALSHDGGQIIMAMGALGSGKSHLSVAIIEACLRATVGITGPAVRPTAVIAFHTNQVNATLPQILAGLRKNSRPKDLRELAELFGVLSPGPIARMNLVLPQWLMEDFADALLPYVALGLQVLPLKLRLPQLSQTALEALLGGGDAQYVQRLLEKAQELGDDLTIEAWEQELKGCTGLTAATLNAARQRLRLLGLIAAQPGEPDVWEAVGPGVLTVFHLSGKRIGRHDVMPLCVALLTTLSEPSPGHGPMQRVFLLDEVNRFERDSALWPMLTQVARQIRHQGSMLVMMGQDFMNVPEELLALATMFALFKVRSQRIFDHARDRVAGYRGRSLEQASVLEPGQALVVVADSTDPEWTEALLVRFRPLCCEHGGDTRAEI